jgi:hypothetical protein
MNSNEMKVLEEEIKQMKYEHRNSVNRIQRHLGTNVCDMHQEWQYHKPTTYQHVSEN